MDPDVEAYVQANRAHYDEIGQRSGNSGLHIHSPELSLLVGEAILDAYDFDEDTTHVMDYACGDGEPPFPRGNPARITHDCWRMK